MIIPPVAAKKPVERVHHNDVYVDNYEWLRDKESPAVIAHLEAENAYTEARTEHLTLLQEQIFEEITDRTQETDLSVPVRRGQWWYYTRTVEGLEYGIHCRAPVDGPDDWDPPVVSPSTAATVHGQAEDAPALPGEQVLLDDNAEAAGHDFYSLGSFDLSSDGGLLLYGVDTEGDERYTLRIRDIDHGRIHRPASIADDDTDAVDLSTNNLADEIPGTAAGAMFDRSGRYVFYTTVDEAWRPDTVWRHEIGTPREADVSVFHEPDERFWVGVGRTRSRAYLVIEAGSSVTSETRLLASDDPTGEFTVVWPRREGVEYDVEHAVIGGEDRLLIVHNHNAVNFELVSVAAADPQGAALTMLPHNPAVRLESVDAFRDFVVVEYRSEGLTRVAIARRDDKKKIGLTELKFGELLYSVGTMGNPEWEQPTIRLNYTSFVTPSTVYDVARTGSGRSRRARAAACAAGARRWPRPRRRPSTG